MGDRRKPKGIEYLDSEYMIFNDLQYWNLTTQQYGTLPDIPHTDSSFRLERKRAPAKGTSFFLFHEHYHTGPIVFSLLDPFGSDSIDLRYRISLIAFPDYRLIETFDRVDGTEDRAICDIEFLDTPNRFLMGTMSGIYLCER